MKSTNYYNTFIAVADDCPLSRAEEPPLPGREENKTAANIQFEMIRDHPYRFRSDDVLFRVFAIKNQISETALASEKEKFFSKGQPCFRASPLTKRYGWGLHSNNEGKIALYAVESEEYKKLAEDNKLKQVMPCVPNGNKKNPELYKK